MFQAMKKLRTTIAGDRRGVTAMEYGLIAAVIAGVVVVSATSLGTTVNGVFTNVGGAIAASTPSA